MRRRSRRRFDRGTLGREGLGQRLGSRLGQLDFQRWLKPDSNYKYRGKLADWKSPSPNLGAATPATQSAMDAAELVLAKSGASFRRDAVDIRVTDDVRNRRGRLLDSQKEVGGWPELRSATPPADSLVAYVERRSYSRKYFTPALRSAVSQTFLKLRW